MQGQKYATIKLYSIVSRFMIDLTDLQSSMRNGKKGIKGGLFKSVAEYTIHA
jgi:hypothetical protein